MTHHGPAVPERPHDDLAARVARGSHELGDGARAGADAGRVALGPMPRPVGRRPLTPAIVLRLQRTAGNAAVEGLVGVARRADAGSGPVSDPERREGECGCGGAAGMCERCGEGGAMVQREPADAGVPAGGGPGGGSGAAGGDEIVFEGLRLTPDRTGLRDQLKEYMTKQGEKAASDFVTRFADHVQLQRGNRSDMSGVTPELEAANRAVEVGDRILPVLRGELASVLEENKQFLRSFETAGTLALGKILRESEDRALGEQERYGLTRTDKLVDRPRRDDYGVRSVEKKLETSYGMSANPDTQGLATAAGALADKVREIKARVQERNDLMVFNPGGEHTSPAPDLWSDPARHATLETQIRTLRRDYELLRFEKQAEFPILAASTEIASEAYVDLDRVIDRLSTVANSTKSADARSAAAEQLGTEVADRLTKIATVRADLDAGDVTVWKLPDIVAGTKGRLGIAPDSLRSRLVDDKVAADASFKANLELVLGVLAFGLGVLAAPLTGGASLTVSGAVVAGGAALGAAAIGTYIAYEHMQEYAMQQAQRGTDFDKSRAIAAEDPSLFWLALDVVGAIADIFAAGAAFTRLAPIVREALALGRAADTAEGAVASERALTAVAAAGGRESGGLGQQLRMSVERQGARDAAGAKGAAKRWEDALEPQTQAFLDGHPGVKVTFMEMDPEVRSLLTHCSDLCIPPNVTAGQVQRLRALLNELNPRQRSALREFLYANRGNLEGAIAQLEKAPPDDLAAGLDDVFDALQAGEIPQEGDLISIGRRKRGDIPDIIGGAPGQRVSPELVRQVQAVSGLPISAAPSSVVAAWNAARAQVLAGNELPLTRELVNKTLYPRAQQKFWANVQASDARSWFVAHGIDWIGGKGGAPLIVAARDFPGQEREFLISLDHIAAKATGDNWRRGLDADNLRFVTFWDNWLMAQIERGLAGIAP